MFSTAVDETRLKSLNSCLTRHISTQSYDVTPVLFPVTVVRLYIDVYRIPEYSTL